MLRVVGTAYHFFLLEEAVGKETPRVLSVLGASAVSCSSDKFHRRDAERAEITQRKARSRGAEARSLPFEEEVAGRAG